MTTNQKAIEAAAKALIWEESQGIYEYRPEGHPDRDDTDRYAEKHSAAALEAAAPYLIRDARAEGWGEAIEFMGQASSSAFHAQMLRFEAHKRYGADRAAAIRAGAE